MTFLSEGLLVTEIGGRVWFISDGDGARKELRFQHRQNLVNLLDVEADAQSGLVYVSAQTIDGLRILRGQYTGTSIDNPKMILKVSGERKIPRFAGGRLLLLNEDTLLVSVGDDVPSSAQHDSSYFGKILLLRGIRNRPDVRIAATGVRNVQGIAAHRGKVVFTDHGPVGGDELNVLEYGADYGWPTGGGRRPITSWTPAIAPSSLTALDDGDLLVSSLLDMAVWKLHMPDEKPLQQTCFLALQERIRLVKARTSKGVYILTDAGRVLMRLRGEAK